MRFFNSGSERTSSSERSFIIITPKEKDKLELVETKFPRSEGLIENIKEETKTSEIIENKKVENAKTGGSNTVNTKGSKGFKGERLNAESKTPRPERLNKKNAAFLRALKKGSGFKRI